jgi:CRP/FNR family transcriptional regulator, cyclic AMP receptor protein
VRPDGTLVGLRLTHELIGYLVGARRPSVSTALGRLQRDGRLRREGRHWLLLGEPPDRQRGGDGRPALEASRSR